MNLSEAIEGFFEITSRFYGRVMSYKISPLERSKERNGNKYNEHLVNVKFCAWCWGPRSETNSPSAQAV